MNILTLQNPPVVDASVAVKWFLPEVHDEAARRLLEDNHFVANQRLQIPDFFFAEVGNILWEKIRHQELSLEKGQMLLQAMRERPFQVHSHIPLTPAALAIAAQTQRSIYDCLYLALAVSEQTIMITADQKLYNALQTSPLAAYLLWVENIEVSNK